MRKSWRDDAFDHHVWATLRLFDTCLELSPAQLETMVPGTYGSILSTLRHLVAGDVDYLANIAADLATRLKAEHMDLAELRAAMERNGAAWSSLLARDVDPDDIVVERDVDGFVRHATIGLRLAQAVHHGTDHRSQVCAALTALGVKPPFIDVWDFGIDTGRSVESMSGS
jgi:uncharacterized damage-inducible protein DinB